MLVLLPLPLRLGARPLSDGVRERETERGETERCGERDNERVLALPAAEAGVGERVRPREGLRDGMVDDGFWVMVCW